MHRMIPAVLSCPLPVPAAPGRLVSAAAARRMLLDHESALRRRTIAALGPNAAFHRGRASVHAEVLDAIGDGPLTWHRCRQLAEAFLHKARPLHAAAGICPARALTPAEIFDKARLEELVLSALRFSAGTAAEHPRSDEEYAARVRLLLSEGVTDTEALLTEVWNDALWG